MSHGRRLDSEECGAVNFIALGVRVKDDGVFTSRSAPASASST
jgi:hypothetical protein